MDKCKWYKSETSIMGSKTLSAGRNPKKPIVNKKWRCNHIKSLYPLGAIDGRNVPCEGDIEKCVIPDHLQV